ncbi:MAG TPA: alpha/beta fold hydrolase [Chloroflexota bacterium]|nr:alpha/beta fold hydrolase [Chloroflexota bacterium]
MAVISEAATSKFAQVGDVRIHYNEVGTGDPLICLHGAGPGASSWSNFRTNLDAFSAQYRTILWDMPQYGKSSKIVIDKPRLTFISGILREFMDQLGIERARFVGNSMGGQVAIKLAIDAPERVEKLVVIGSTPVGQSLFCPMPLEGIKMIGDYYKGEGPSLEKMRTLIQTLLFDSSFLTEQVLQERYEASLDPEVIRIMRDQPPGREDLADQLHKVACPALIVWGMDDRFGALDIGLLMLRRFQNARMHIFSKCGHWAQVEHADEFNSLVLDFLARQ